MFAQIVKVGSGRHTYHYLRILESYRENGVSKHRVVANLGRVDQLAGKIDPLVQSLSRYGQQRLIVPGRVTAETLVPWGPILLARHLYRSLQLGSIIRNACGPSRRRFDVAETAFVLVANRLTDPRSEHGLARWLENYYVCDASGTRWQPDWLPEEQISSEQRVRVEPRQLNLWYRTLDALLEAKADIEKQLYLRVRDLFSLDVDMVLYDVTSTYFERRSPEGVLRRHGYSRDGRPREVQVLLGVVIANGFPIAHHVFPGNRADKTTLQTMVTDLEERFGLRRVMIVGDRGFVSEKNLEFLTEGERQLRYLIGMPGRRSREAAEVLQRLPDGPWAAVDDANRVQRVLLDAPDRQYFVVDSQERKAYEQQERERSVERAGQALAKVESAVNAGRLKDPAKIGARAQRALSQHHADRYYSYEIPQAGVFRFWLDPDKLAAEIQREGRYVLKTNDLTLTAHQSVRFYKQLSDVEWAYRDLKDVIRMRPVYHQSDDRVKAHLFVATLALFLKRTLEKQLAPASLSLTPTEAFAAMHSVGLGVLNFDGQTQLLTSGGGRDARRILKALDITELKPPGAS